MYTLRPFDTENFKDYEGITALDHAVWPDDPSLPSEWQKGDELRPKDVYYRRWVAEENGRFVGQITVMEPWWSPESGKYQIELRVHPEYHGNGMYRTLHDWALEAVSAEITPTKLIAETRENFTNYRATLEALGYKVVMRFPYSRLDLATFDPGNYADIVQRVADSGIRTYTLTQLRQRDDDWMIRQEDLEWEIIQDIPYHGELVRQPMEQFAKMFEYDNFTADGWFIAVDEATDNYVAVSSIWLSLGNPDKLYTGLTGVRRAYRRRGIATALKAQAIAWAKAQGVTYLETDNEENNPMYQLNLVLGFRPMPAGLDYILELNHEHC